MRSWVPSSSSPSSPSSLDDGTTQQQQQQPLLVDTPIPVDENEDCVYPNDAELWNTTEPNVYGEINVGCSVGYPDRVLFTELGRVNDGSKYELRGDVSTNEKYRDVDYYRFHTESDLTMTVTVDSTTDMIHNVGVNILAPNDLPPDSSPFCPNAHFTEMTRDTTQTYLLPSGYRYGVAFGALMANTDCTLYTVEVLFD